MKRAALVLFVVVLSAPAALAQQDCCTVKDPATLASRETLVPVRTEIRVAPRTAVELGR